MKTKTMALTVSLALGLVVEDRGRTAYRLVQIPLDVSSFKRLARLTLAAVGERLASVLFGWTVPKVMVV